MWYPPYEAPSNGPLANEHISRLYLLFQSLKYPRWLPNIWSIKVDNCELQNDQAHTLGLTFRSISRGDQK
jgi:hypothetical protein